jgi:uncharacterized protein
VWFLLTLTALQAVQLPPPPRGFSPTEADMVVDAAGVLSADAVQRMNQSIFGLKTRYGGEIVVVTLRDIGGREASDLALRIGREWRVGEAGEIGSRSRNAGVVVLLIPKETASDGRGQISIQTGRGAEGFIPDGVAGEIRREAIPALQRADYSAALELITTRLVERYDRAFGPQGARERADGGQSVRRGVGAIPKEMGLVVVVLVLLVLWALVNSARHRGLRGCLYLLATEAARPRRSSGWGGSSGGGFGGGSWGGGGGGFGGFGGGGGFSGGGSSGSW